MKASQIYVKRLFNLGNFQNLEVGITIDIEPDENVTQCITKTMQYIETFNPKGAIIDQIRHAEKIIENPDDYTGREVKEAKEILERHQEIISGLPF